MTDNAISHGSKRLERPAVTGAKRFTQKDFGELVLGARGDSPATARLRYLAGVLDHGVGALVANARDVRMEVVAVGKKVVPVLVNDGSSDECYFAAPESHYIRYLRHEIEHIRKRPILSRLSAALGPIGLALRLMGINRSVSVNNWLFSTNPSQAFTRSELMGILGVLKATYPSHAYVLRTVDPNDLVLLEHLEALGWRLIVNRPVHTWDPLRFAELHPGKRGNVRRDIRALEKSGLRIGTHTELTVADPQRFADLYQSLYINKHSRFNARFTPAYFRVLIETGPVEMSTLHAGREIVGFVAHFLDAQTIVPTIIGYDTSSPKDNGLYRLIMAVLFRMSLETGKQLFLSTGASSFKLNRGSTERLEYEAIYDRHLEPRARLPWRIMRSTFERTLRLIDTREL